MDYLADKEVEGSIWLKAYAKNFITTCCGCHNSTQVGYIVSIVPEKYRNSTYRDKLRSCGTDEHTVCHLCQSCGKKLGFEW